MHCERDDTRNCMVYIDFSEMRAANMYHVCETYIQEGSEREFKQHIVQTNDCLLL